MKKIFVLISCILLLVGCSSETIENKDDYTKDESSNSELKEPILEWCQLYNPNGYNTITCVVSNPNSVDIDISYDLVYYKNNEEVSRTKEKWSNNQISSKHNDVIWSNDDIPSSQDVDDIKMENITVSKSYYDSIEADIKYIETIEDKAYFQVKNSVVPTLNTIWIFEYNDNNKNKKCDKGELVVVSFKNVFNKEEKISVDTDVYEYDSYEIYYNAY